MQFFFVFMEGEVANSHAISARFIKDNFSDTTRIGGLQSGTIGYFNSNVFNLDGKLDPEVLRYLKKDKLHEFVDKRKIDVFIDWRGLERAFDSTYFKNNWQEFKGAKINNDTSSCFVRIIK
ncbi:MAG: hypothetical protein C0425_11500 [Chlorobiaceae bacterium]|nr:hypothetical protein [Chlorobiaceae bacterium]MBA4310940.1 hypothetical protein [Chlorobiaceae bacterium]